MTTDEELKELREKTKDLTGKIDVLSSKLENELGKRDGGQKVTAWWATGTAVLIGAWLGATSLWHIPALVAKTASGQAEQRAKQAADNAERDAKAVRALLDKNSVYTLQNPGSGALLGVVDRGPNQTPLIGSNTKDNRTFTTQDPQTYWVLRLAPSP